MLVYYNSEDKGRKYDYDFGIDAHNDINNQIIQIEKDRYNGAYSDHSYTAWLGPRPDDPSSGDSICEEFWNKWKGKAIYGGGQTPQESYLDLIQKFDALGIMIEDDPPCRGSLLVVTLHHISTPDVAFVYRSDEFRQWIKERTQN